jgi:hypothetical protein
MDPCPVVLRVEPRRILLVVVGALILSALFAAPAAAFTVQGGTAAQRAYVSQVIESCDLAPSLTDAELCALGPVKVVLVDMVGVTAYSKVGAVYVDSDFEPGELLGELVAHEWSHQIWYSLGPKWWQKWAELCDPSGLACDCSWCLNVPENFAECARVALWGNEYSLRDCACTDLVVTDPPALRDWVALARYANQCPFADLNPKAMPSTAEDDELAAAAGYAHAMGFMQGFANGAFRPDAALTRAQLAAVCGRAGLPCPVEWRSDSGVATRGEVRDCIPGLYWTAGDWSKPITRGQVARLMWRTR